MAERELKLNGGEIAMVKALGLSGAPRSGPMLLARLGNWDESEFLDTLTGLLDQGYLLSNKVNVRLMEDVERAAFRINPAYARALKEALRPPSQQQHGRNTRRRAR